MTQDLKQKIKLLRVATVVPIVFKVFTAKTKARKPKIRMEDTVRPPKVFIVKHPHEWKKSFVTEHDYRKRVSNFDQIPAGIVYLADRIKRKFSYWKRTDSRRAKLLRAAGLTAEEWGVCVAADIIEINDIFAATARYDGLFDNHNVVSCLFQNAPGDGNCLFHAIGFLVGETAARVRNRIVQFLLALGPEDVQTRYVGHIRDVNRLSSHIENMGRSSVWGTELELCAAGDVYSRAVYFYHYSRTAKFVFNPNAIHIMRIAMVKNNHYIALATFPQYGNILGEKLLKKEGFVRPISQ